MSDPNGAPDGTIGLVLDWQDLVERERAEIERLRGQIAAQETIITTYRDGTQRAVADNADLRATIADLTDALEQAIDDFGDSHCVCEATKQQCIAALAKAQGGKE
jgi:hypothetical protein